MYDCMSFNVYIDSRKHHNQVTTQIPSCCPSVFKLPCAPHPLPGPLSLATTDTLSLQFCLFHINGWLVIF